MDPELKELSDLANSIATEAAALVRPRAGDEFETTTKTSATDMVTEMDRASEELIVARLRSARPDDGLIGEEGTDAEGTTGYVWLIDPIDGTTNYLYGHPGFAVSIAAERDGEAVVGVVYDVLHDEAFSAIRGGGATRNGEPISVSGATDAAHSLVATGFSYVPERRAVQAAVLAEVMPGIRDIRRMGAAAVDLCSVACGRVDAYYENPIGRWDVAAGALIAAEAGARVGTVLGEPFAPGSILAASPELFDELQAMIESAGIGSVPLGPDVPR